MSEIIVNGGAVAASNTHVEIMRTFGTRPSRSVPTLRHGSQAYFWSADWQRSERLADYDFLIGGDNEYRPTDVEDLIQELNA